MAELEAGCPSRLLFSGSILEAWERGLERRKAAPNDQRAKETKRANSARNTFSLQSDGAAKNWV